MSTIGRKRTPDGVARVSDDTGGDAGNGGHEETQLDRIQRGWKIQRGLPEYQHARLPWIYEQQARITSHVTDWGFRMTSIYDPFIVSNAFDIDPGAAVTRAFKLAPEVGGVGPDTRQDSGRNVAFFDFWTSLYLYYSVISCRYKVRVENLSHEKFWVHSMFVTNTNPPSEASSHDMLLWKGVKSQLVQPYFKFSEPDSVRVRQQEAIDNNDDNDVMELATTDNNSAVAAQFISNPTGSNFAYIQGEYHPGTADKEIHLDDAVSIWTSVNANPTLREALMIRIRPYDNASVSPLGTAVPQERDLTYNITVECEYLVEFKELNAAVRWPVTRNPATVIFATDPRTPGL